MPLELAALDHDLDEWLRLLPPAGKRELAALVRACGGDASVVDAPRLSISPSPPAAPAGSGSLILDEETLTALAMQVGARFAVSGEVRQAALRASVREAGHLAEDTFEAPAALVYALARNRSVFAAFAPMVVAAAFMQARASGLALAAPPKAIADIADAVTASDMRYEDVRAFFASETFPLGRVDG